MRKKCSNRKYSALPLALCLFATFGPLAIAAETTNGPRAFVDGTGTGWVVLDFKTDAEDLQGQSTYRRQLGWYIHAMEKLMGTLVSGYLLYV